MSATCETCRYWRRYSDEAPKGVCRRYPPHVIAEVDTLSANDRIGRSEPEVTSHTVSEWPETPANEWCGEHESE